MTGLVKLKKFFALFLLLVLFTACSNGYTGLKNPLDVSQASYSVSCKGGIAAEVDNKVYYINGDNFMREQESRFHEFAGALCRMNIDGSEKEIVLNKDICVFDIDKKIYMCIYENGSCIAASVNLDGTEYKKLKKIDDIYNGGCYAYGSGKIYYTLDYKLYSIDVDGKNEKKITDFKIYNLRVFGENVYFTREVDENIGNIYTLKENGIVEITNSPGYVLNITENYMYFYMLDNKKVYRYDQETSSSEAIIHGGYTEYLFTDDFYAVSYAENDEENAGIYIIPIGGGSKTQVSSFNGSCMSYRDGYIYFINSSKLNYLYRVKIDGSGEECISEEFVFDYDTLNISGKWLYFFSDSDYDRVYRADTESLYVECIEFEDIAVVG